MPIIPQFVRHLILKIKGAFNSGSASTKNRFSSAKSRIPKRGKIPDPYEDWSSQTGSYGLQSSPTTLITSVDTTAAIPSPGDRDHQDPAMQDLESGGTRWWSSTSLDKDCSRENDIIIPRDPV